MRVIYSCVVEENESIRMSLGSDLTSDPPERAPRFRERVVAYNGPDSYEEERARSYAAGWNSCRSGDQPCTSGGYALARFTDADGYPDEGKAISWLIGDFDIEPLAGDRLETLLSIGEIETVDLWREG